MKKKTIGLIPVRLHSKRLHKKSILMISKYPMFVHVYKRAKLSKALDDLIVCCDDIKIFNLAKKYNVKCMLTSKKHKNGTERINEAYKKIKKKYDFIIDIQGDEPLLNPIHIDKVIKYHKKNDNADIILPTFKVYTKNNLNIVKVAKDAKHNVIYLSRNDIPFYFNRKKKLMDKHLSIISFKPKALVKFSKFKKTFLEKIENIELLRALEIGLKIKSVELKGDSFSIDVKKDFYKVKRKLTKDKIFNRYK